MIQTRDGTKLRIGLLVDDVVINKYVKGLADWCQVRPDIDIVCIIHQKISKAVSRNSYRTRHAQQCLSSVFFRIITSFEIALLRWIGTRGYLVSGATLTDHFTTFSIMDTGAIVEPLGLVAAAPHSSYHCSDESIETLKTLQIDLLIQCSPGALPDEIFTITKLGVLRFRYDECDGPPGFWPTYYGRKSTGCKIEMLRSDNRSCKVLMSGTFCTKILYSLNQAHLYTHSYCHLKRLLKQLPSVPTGEGTRTVHDGFTQWVYTPPSWPQSVIYLIKITSRLALISLQSLIKLRQRWSISIVSASDSVVPARDVKHELRKSAEIRPPKGRYWADPFLCAKGNRIYCFVEEYVYEAKRGHITAIEIRDAGIKKYGPVLVEPFHLSFPYVFNFEGDTFMCPECSASKEIRLYRCIDFPRQWQLKTVLMRDVSAVDTMIFLKDAKWWMLTNIDFAGLNDHTAELYLFYADTPLSDNWTPHAQNPIRIDSEGGRNAGLIFEKEKIYRVGQRQGFGQYGGGISIYEIRVLDTTSYTEALVRKIDPDFRKGLLGTHHLSRVAGMMAIDHVKREFIS